MYFPDLTSVRKLAESMSRHQKEENKYRGLIPKTEKELPEARLQLGQYFRTIWKDNIQALEVELGVSKENYEKKISGAIKAQFITKAFYSLSDHEQNNLRGLGGCPFPKGDAH